MKRIITCSDGTWCRPNITIDGHHRHTNVQKIFNCILRQQGDIYQIKHYDEGVGTEGTFLKKLFGAVTGDGIDANILDAYKFISWNYEPGDQLYLFGFSRGAYTARSLAGLIRKCGILKTNDLDLIDDAYAMYRDRTVSPDSEKAQEFRTNYSYPDSRIKFIGVWDTVGELGIPLPIFQWYNKKKYGFYDTMLSSTVDYAYHALSIDERRSTFVPTLWKRSPKVATHNIQQVLEQQWFAGTHSNIGGGEQNEGLSDLTLHWMIGKARQAGLGFNEELIKEQVKGDCTGVLVNSATGIFALLPKYIRPVCHHTGIDQSVYERMDKMSSYQPPNILNRDHYTSGKKGCEGV